MVEQRQIDELFLKMNEERARLLQQAKILSEIESARVLAVGAQGEAEWTAKEQWAHLAESEANYRAFIVAGLETDRPDVHATMREPVHIPRTEAAGATNTALLAQLQAERQKTLAVLRAMTAEQFDRTVRQRQLGEMTLLQWARSCYRHDRMHLDQIAGRPSAYRANLTGGTE